MKIFLSFQQWFHKLEHVCLTCWTKQSFNTLWKLSFLLRNLCKHFSIEALQLTDNELILIFCLDHSSSFQSNCNDKFRHNIHNLLFCQWFLNRRNSFLKLIDSVNWGRKRERNWCFEGIEEQLLVESEQNDKCLLFQAIKFG